jgi:hypothetical protein
VTKTEEALQALIAALNASVDLPDVRRSALLDDILEEMDGETGVSRALVIQDGDADMNVDEMETGLGEGRFFLEHHAELEWIVAARDGTELATHFDAGLEAIAAVIEADRTLSGAVEMADMRIPPERGLEVAGARPAKTARIIVTLEFQSRRPF